MRKVKSQDTSPEITVRRLLRTAGASGYRLHRQDLAGKPDIVFIGKKLAIFVHGCFWHGHNCPRGSRIPKTNTDYWQTKIEKTKSRDNLNQEKLKTAGWQIMVIWECELKHPEQLTERMMDAIQAFICR